MTKEQRKLCRGFITFPTRERKITREDFLRQFPSAVENGRLALRWLEEAFQTRNAEDLQCALLIGFNFGFGLELKDILTGLTDVDWHTCHEDLISVLQAWPTEDMVEVFFRATQWIPKSLEYDDNRALAVKAIWALGKIPGPEAHSKLQTLACSENAILKKAASEQLYRRRIVY